MQGRVLQMESSRHTWGQSLTNSSYHRICLDSLVEHFGFLPEYLAAPMFLSFASYVSFNTNKVAIIIQQYLKVLHWTSSLGVSQQPKLKRSKQSFFFGGGGGQYFILVCYLWTCPFVFLFFFSGKSQERVFQVSCARNPVHTTATCIIYQTKLSKVHPCPAPVLS